MVSSIDVLSYVSLTQAINEIKSPNQFLKRTIFGNHDPRPTETLELSVFVRGRQVAPFVRRGGQAIELAKGSERFYNVSCPNIRIKMHLDPNELVFERRPGVSILPGSSAEIVSAGEAYIARQQQTMADAITEAEEYLSALALRGAISYSVTLPGGEQPEVFTVTLPRSGSHSITLSDFWDTVNGIPSADIFTVKKLLSDDVGLGLTDAILGSEAADAFMSNEEVRGVLDIRNVSAGSLDLTQQFSEDGVIFLGVFCGCRMWGYLRSTTLPSGSSADLIRAKYAEFLSISPAAQNVLYYGAIADLQAGPGGLFQGERFSKSWEEQDPSVRWLLSHSRPLPIPRRPDSMVSMKVVSG